jgi:hypothetical protein
MAHDVLVFFVGAVFGAVALFAIVSFSIGVADKAEAVQSSPQEQVFIEKRNSKE